MRKGLGFCAALLSLYLGLHNGYLALWDGPELKQVFPYGAELYTQTDRQLLAQGIPIPDPQTLSRLMEDYLS